MVCQGEEIEDTLLRKAWRGLKSPHGEDELGNIHEEEKEAELRFHQRNLQSQGTIGELESEFTMTLTVTYYLQTSNVLFT